MWLTGAARGAGRRRFTSLAVVRGLGFVVIVLLFGVLLTACTPPGITITAVFLDDGQPTAVVRPCSGTEVDRVSVSAGQQHWVVADTRPPGSRDPVTEFPLLETPSGWSQQITAPGALLTTFADDGPYHLSAGTTRPSAGVDTGIRFTLNDLRSLGDGQVWAARKAYADGEAMSRQDFEKSAARSC